MSVDWNLDPTRITEIPIIQIKFDPKILTDIHNSPPLRLLVLSHQIAYQGTPAFFLESTPPYSNQNDGQPVCLVFDIKKNFEDIFEFPFWATFEKWTWSPSFGFTPEFTDHLSRAITLLYFYYYQKFNPLYFTSYILVPAQEGIVESFLVQPVPVFRGNFIQVRNVVQSGLSSIVNPKAMPKVGSYILLPPNEHPLKISSISANQITAVTVNKTSITFEPNASNGNYVLLTRPSLVIPKFFDSHFINFNMNSSKSMNSGLNSNQNQINSNFQQQNIMTESQVDQQGYCQFKNLDIFNFNQKDIDNFYAQNFSKKKQQQKQESTEMLVSYLEDSNPTPEQIISEQISDHKIRRTILKAFNLIDCFPSKRSNLTCIVANFLSYFRFDFGFSTVLPPQCGQIFEKTETVPYRRLGIPDVLINSNGNAFEVNALNLLQQWEKERFIPIFGPKDAHFIVFLENNLDISSVEAFMTQFCHTYTQHGFGKLTPYPRTNAYIPVPPNDMSKAVMSFFTSHPLIQFQQYPVLTFIVSSPIFDIKFQPRSFVNYIIPSKVQSATEDDMKTLSFVVYSRIRNFSSEPNGKIEPLQYESAVMFFGFTYSPPFVLKRNKSKMIMHIAFDPISKLSIWINDTGTVLSVYPNKEISDIANLMQQCKSMFAPSDIIEKFTVSILGETICSSLLHECDAFLPQGTELYAVYPAAAVRAHFDNEFADDVAIFDEQEISMGLSIHDQNGNLQTIEKPAAACFVLSQHHPAYKASIYRGSGIDMSNCLLEFVTQMSHLSWLSVKPGSDYRTISYPPHIAALLRKNNCSVFSISRFEFLPSNERI
ncbi:hypothetical protein TRFO_21310 [Tritrichomonas foetus]|uniref:Uncharacterized protein n=1 Tax=Tritrichomonas foetus TaxID=1144522 RepID=A0A1J4KIQ3_9EUKA|nr:hypothetical protein TRFO_21310 [Tritrichomonas foetus]|eukprot:OHT09692.1 hypothetical protein TRFO_21310 [Tritrichomonas foetus]